MTRLGMLSGCLALAAMAAAAGIATAGGLNCGLPGGDAPAKLTIARPAKGDQALVVSGQVFRPDGVTPAPGVVLYVYHTDSRGLYALLPGATPRLRAWLRTDGEGRYEYRTIRPAPYPLGRDAAHVHTQLWGDGVPPQWGTTLLFADDELVGDGERRKSQSLGRFAYVCEAKKGADGALACRHDLRLKARGDEFERVTRHGLERPAARAARGGG